ncbi:hypothetical protein PARU111607_07685 [Palleronia rufa]
MHERRRKRYGVLTHRHRHRLFDHVDIRLVECPDLFPCATAAVPARPAIVVVPGQEPPGHMRGLRHDRGGLSPSTGGGVDRVEKIAGDEHVRRRLRPGDRGSGRNGLEPREAKAIGLFEPAEGPPMVQIGAVDEAEFGLRRTLWGAMKAPRYASPIAFDPCINSLDLLDRPCEIAVDAEHSDGVKDTVPIVPVQPLDRRVRVFGRFVGPVGVGFFVGRLF